MNSNDDDGLTSRQDAEGDAPHNGGVNISVDIVALKSAAATSAPVQKSIPQSDDDDDYDDVVVVGVKTTYRTQLTVSPPDDPPLWRMFQYQNHSLVLYASHVAACAGFNPFQSIPELMMKHVYQGRGGRALLDHDANLLGLEMVQQTEEDELLEIAQQAGASTTQALQQALEVKRGDRKLESIEGAQKLRQEVVEAARASQKLSQRQLEQLEEGTRQSVDTGCGHSWEDAALDRYEKQCGWEVHDRNAECRQWNFVRVDHLDEEDGEKSRKRKRTEVVPSIRPVGPATAPGRRRDASRRDEKDDKLSTEETARTETMSDNSDIAIQNSLLLGESEMSIRHDASSTGEPQDAAQQTHPSREASVAPASSPPYLTIKGMVDGIREELAPALRNQSKEELDDDSWILRRVIVECKHRMRSLLPNPRFHELIQAVVYCYMYEADEADILQVLRTKNEREKKPKVVHEIVANGQGRETKSPAQPKVDECVEDTKPKKGLMTDYFEKGSPQKENRTLEASLEASTEITHSQLSSSDENGVSKNESRRNDIVQKVATDSASAKPATSANMQLAVSRVSLHGPMNHHSNWNSVVLPNLRQWADAVYSIRGSDEKRYRFLTCMAMAQSLGGDEGAMDSEAIRAAWDLVLCECPFLAQGVSGDRYRRECFS